MVSEWKTGCSQSRAIRRDTSGRWPGEGNWGQRTEGFALCELVTAASAFQL